MAKKLRHARGAFASKTDWVGKFYDSKAKSNGWTNSKGTLYVVKNASFPRVEHRDLKAPETSQTSLSPKRSTACSQKAVEKAAVRKKAATPPLPLNATD